MSRDRSHRYRLAATRINPSFCRNERAPMPLYGFSPPRPQKETHVTSIPPERFLPPRFAEKKRSRHYRCTNLVNIVVIVIVVVPVLFVPDLRIDHILVPRRRGLFKVPQPGDPPPFFPSFSSAR